VVADRRSVDHADTEGRHPDRIGRGRDTQRTGGHSGPDVHRLVDDQIRLHLLERRNQGRADQVGGGVAEHRHAQFEPFDVRVAALRLPYHPIQVHSAGDAAHRAKWQPAQERFPDGYRDVVSGLGAGQRKRHHRIEVSVRGDRRKYDLHRDIGHGRAGNQVSLAPESPARPPRRHRVSRPTCASPQRHEKMIIPESGHHPHGENVRIQTISALAGRHTPCSSRTVAIRAANGLVKLRVSSKVLS